MSWLFGDPAPQPAPRPPVNKSRSRAGALQAELDILTAEDEFLAKKLAGTLTKQDRLDLRETRKNYRLKHRKPVQPGEGAAPPNIVVSTEVKVPGAD